MLARRQPLTHLSRHGDVVTSLTLSFADDHLENETVVLGSAPDLNHVDLLGDARVLKGYILRWIPYTRLTSGKPDLRIPCTRFNSLRPVSRPTGEEGSPTLGAVKTVQPALTKCYDFPEGRNRSRIRLG